MPLLNEAGTWAAYPMQIGIGETKSGLAQVSIQYGISQRADGDQWADCDDQRWDITGFMTLECHDGSLNTMSIDQLKDAFPDWDGVDLQALQNDDRLLDQPVQIRTDFETYEGKQRLRVQWLSRYGDKPTYGGGGAVRQADDGTVKRIMNRLGSKLRAHGGGKQAAAPKSKPAAKAKPKPGGAPSRPSPPAAKSEPPAETSTAEECWQVHLGRCEQDMTDEEVEAAWWAKFDPMFPERSTDSLTPEEWGQFKAALTA